jgi:predicted 3-demethylubiquinone-9 3-methyltransferase (glyoxalase superfamily)
MSKMCPCLWFDDQAEPAANVYVRSQARALPSTHWGQQPQTPIP